MIETFIGKQFNALTLLEIIPGTKTIPRTCRCLCECGNIILCKYAAVFNLSRKSCDRLECKIKNRKPLKTKFISKYIMLQLWNRLQIIATQNTKKKLFLISAEYLDLIWENQRGICALSGIEIILPMNAQKFQSHTYTASLDRIDSNIGYIEGNVQWVHKVVNIMKQELKDEEFINLCKKVSNANRL